MKKYKQKIGNQINLIQPITENNNCEDDSHNQIQYNIFPYYIDH